MRGTNPNDAASKNGTIFADANQGSDTYKGWLASIVDDLGPKKTVLGAVGATISGDTVQMAPGTYTGVLVQPGTKNLILRANGTVTWSGN